MEVIHLLKVKAKKGQPGKAGELDVDDSGGLKVKRNTDPIVIVWWLKDSGNIVFEEPKAVRQGFNWFNSPPPGVFSGPLRSADGKRLILDDCNIADNDAPNGWIYVLRAYDTVTKEIYETITRIVDPPKGEDEDEDEDQDGDGCEGEDKRKKATTNPAIINK